MSIFVDRAMKEVQKTFDAPSQVLYPHINKHTCKKEIIRALHFLMFAVFAVFYFS